MPSDSPVTIESVDDPRLADYRLLRERSGARGESGDYFVCEGSLIVKRLMASDYDVRSVIVDSGRDPGLLESEHRPDVPVYRLSRDQIQTLAGFRFHRGYLASAARKPLPGLDHFAPDRLSLALFQIFDMENMGSLIRSAAALGIRQILVDRASVDPFSRRVLRVSMGAALGMRFIAMEDSIDALKRLDALGVRTLATTLASGAIPINQVPRSESPSVLLLGNEAEGLPAAVQRAASERVTIPMHRPDATELVDSLNVAVAGAICLYELTRQRS